MINEGLYASGLPPRIEEVKTYFNQKGLPEPEAEAFFHFYERKHWKSKRGTYFKSWKRVAFGWVVSVLSQQPSMLTRVMQ